MTASPRQKSWKVAWAAGLLAVGLPCAGAPSEPASRAEAEVDAMHELLVAEFALQRGDVTGALEIYLRLAAELRDPAIARRAVEAAIRARAHNPAIEACALLLEIEPDSSLGREIMASLLASDGGPEKAGKRMAELLSRSRDPAALLTQLSFLFARMTDKAAVLKETRALVIPYAKLPESNYALGVAALVAGDLDLAMAESRLAMERREGWERAAVLRAQVLRKAAPDQVIAHYQSFVERYPKATEVRMQLGRELAGDKRSAEAREQFREVERLSEKDPQAAYAVGLLSLQLEDWEEAHAAFRRALDQGLRDASSAYLSLGAAAEGLKRYDEAIDWYRRVDSAEWIRAQLKIATLIGRQQGLAAGREYLRTIEPRSADDRIQVIQVEAQLLRDAKAWKDTYDMLSKAVEDFPESFELLYDRAMAAERVDKLDVLEQDLRRVIQMKPDYAHAYNALGYTLADRTNRLGEAKALIDQAVKLLPDDPFILDSLGWVLYRLGHKEEAITHLRAAYRGRPDPEIAAHLGEVLWSAGQRDEARRIWAAALTANPGHETLLAVIEKFKP